LTYLHVIQPNKSQLSHRLEERALLFDEPRSATVQAWQLEGSKENGYGYGSNMG
jgi:hypothetical protein